VVTIVAVGNWTLDSLQGYEDVVLYHGIRCVHLFETDMVSSQVIMEVMEITQSRSHINAFAFISSYPYMHNTFCYLRRLNKSIMMIGNANVKARLNMLYDEFMDINMFPDSEARDPVASANKQIVE